MRGSNPHHPLTREHARYEAHKRATQARNEQGCAPLCIMVLVALAVAQRQSGGRP